MYELLYPSIRVRTAPPVSLGLVLVLVCTYCSACADLCDSGPESLFTLLACRFSQFIVTVSSVLTLTTWSNLKMSITLAVYVVKTEILLLFVVYQTTENVDLESNVFLVTVGLG